jgi:hypothetical protein
MVLTLSDGPIYMFLLFLTGTLPSRRWRPVPALQAQARKASVPVEIDADRLAALGGALDVRSQPGRGTTLAGQLPVSPSG